MTSAFTPNALTSSGFRILRKPYPSPSSSSDPQAWPTPKSDSSITISRKDGKSVTLKIDSTTKTRGDVAQGKPAVVFSNKGTAVAILAGAERAPDAVEDRGRRGGGPLGVPRGAVHVG